MTLRTTLSAFILGLLLMYSGQALAANITLPPPVLDKQDIFTLLSKRVSVSPNEKLSAQEINLQDLSQLLFATSGLNRPERGWVIPIASGSAPQPYWRVYVLSSEGVFLYNWRNHELLQIKRKDMRELVLVQHFATPPPLIIVFVEDKYLVVDLNEVTGNRYSRIDIGAMAVGGMTQNLYLAAQELGLGTRFIINLKFDEISKLLDLNNDDKILGAMPIWHMPKE